MPWPSTISLLYPLADGQEPQHRAAGLGGRPTTPWVEACNLDKGWSRPGRSGARPGSAAGAPRLPRGGGAAGGDRA